tara:strand:- start:10068 stop:10340 length:273 start_codon:yes stop_codon:yes gene_type:complete
MISGGVDIYFPHSKFIIHTIGISINRRGATMIIVIIAVTIAATPTFSVSITPPPEIDVLYNNVYRVLAISYSDYRRESSPYIYTHQVVFS